VEKVLGKRVVGGVTEYYLSWRGFGPEDNTWEPAENLEHCRELIEEYERDQLPKGDKTEERNSTINNGNGNTNVKRQPTPSTATPAATATEKPQRPVEKGLVDFVISAKFMDDQLKYLVKWKGSDEADWLPSYQAHYKCPDAIIRYFEERDIWRIPHSDIPNGTSPRSPRSRNSNGNKVTRSLSSSSLASSSYSNGTRNGSQ
jgi:hypothetical protein